MTNVKVLLVDDHVLVRAGVRALVQAIAGFEVVAEAGDGREALRLIEKHRPDVVLMDIMMPEMDGLSATAEATARWPESRVIILSMNADEEYVLQARRAGAVGYVLKNVGPAELEQALRAASRGETYLASAVSEKVITQYGQRVGASADGPLSGDVAVLVAEKKRVRRKPTYIEREAHPRVTDLIDIVPPPYFTWKGIVDRAVAALLLIPGLPIIAALMAFVRWTSPGPGLYRQVRVGLRGRLFTIYKIRTMREDAEAATGAVWTQDRDPRITWMGRVLRKTHLDELPQLFNILRGEMSLIGPRPERPEFVRVLATAVPAYLDRLAVPPGVTGLAQINLPADSGLESVCRKLALDLDYIRNASLSLDARTFLCTLARLIGISGSRAPAIFGLRRQLESTEPQDAAQPGQPVLEPVTPMVLVFSKDPDPQDDRLPVSRPDRRRTSAKPKRRRKTKTAAGSDTRNWTVQIPVR